MLCERDRRLVQPRLHQRQTGLREMPPRSLDGHESHVELSFEMASAIGPLRAEQSGCDRLTIEDHQVPQRVNGQQHAAEGARPLS
jgi:hypothetical protein